VIAFTRDRFQGARGDGMDVGTLRPLSGAERQLWLLSRVRPFQVVFALTLPPSHPVPAPDAVGAALRVAGARHPLLCVRVALRGGIPVFEGSDRPIPVRTVPRCTDIDAVISDELNHRIPSDTGPLLRATVIAPEAGPPVLLLTFDHVAADGLSMAAVLRDVVAALAHPGAPGAPRAAPPAIEDILPSIETIPRAVRRPGFWVRFLARRLGELWWRLRYGPIRALPHPAAPAGEQRTHSIRRVLEPDRVAPLRDRAAAEGVSLHAALCAAQILALRTRFSGGDRLPLAVYSPTDLRPRLRWGAGLGVPRDHLGQFVGYARSLHRVGPGADLWAVAREVRDQIRRRVSTSDDLGYHVLNHALMRLLSRWFRPDAQGARRLSRAAARSLSHTTILTNLGELDEALPDGSILHVVASTLPGEVFVSGVARSRGHLGWNFSWTEPCLDRATAAAIADEAVGLLEATR
jgi:hypothetical protein